MTDRELLELAAKAFGINGIYEDKQEMVRSFVFVRMIGVRTKTRRLWNPIDDDGDAFRLAVKLNLVHGKFFARSVADNHQSGDDIYADTRRAIVLAAAEIGREMQC